MNAQIVGVHSTITHFASIDLVPYALYPFSQITLTTSSTYFWHVSLSGASTITQATGSVPDSQTEIQPVSPSAFVTLDTANNS